MTIKPISVHKSVGDVRIKLTVPANSPSGSSSDEGRVLSMMAKENDWGFENDRMCVGESLWNQDFNSVADLGGTMGMCAYISGCGEDNRKNVSQCLFGSKATSLRRSFDTSGTVKGNAEICVIFAASEFFDSRKSCCFQSTCLIPSLGVLILFALRWKESERKEKLG